MAESGGWLAKPPVRVLFRRSSTPEPVLVTMIRPTERFVVFEGVGAAPVVFARRRFDRPLAVKGAE